MLTIGRGQHGSTYGGNPVAARVAIASLQVGGQLISSSQRWLQELAGGARGRRQSSAASPSFTRHAPYTPACSPNKNPASIHLHPPRRC